MRRVSCVLVAVGIFLLLFGCTNPGRDTVSPEPVGPAVPAPPSPTPGAMAAMDRFGTVADEEPTDFRALSAAYEGALSAYVRGVDALYRTTLDADARQAMARGLEGKDVGPNKEWAEKTVQRAFLLSFQRSLSVVRTGPFQPADLSRLVEAAPAARVVLQRRSQWVGKGAEYPDAFDAALDRLRAAADRKNAGDLSVAGAQLDALLTKGLVLSVLFELDGLEKARGTGGEEAAVKCVEARQYYLSLADEHTRRDRAGAATLTEQLERPAEQIDMDLVRGILKNDFLRDLADVNPSLPGL